MASLAGLCCLLWLGVLPHLWHLSCLCYSEACPQDWIGVVPTFINKFSCQHLLRNIYVRISSTKCVQVCLFASHCCLLFLHFLTLASNSNRRGLASSCSFSHLTIQQQFYLQSSHFLVLHNHNTVKQYKSAIKLHIYQLTLMLVLLIKQST